MEIKTNEFSSFLNKVVMTGTQGLGEAILLFDSEGLKIKAASETNQSMVDSILRKEAFKDYEELGKICINDLQTVKKVMKRFDGTVKLSKKGNLLKIYTKGKQVEIELVDESFMKDDKKDPNLEFDDSFIMTGKQLKNIFDDVSLSRDSIIIINTEDKLVKFSNTGKYKFLTEFEAPNCKGGVKVSFGTPLIDAVSELRGDLECSVKSEYPIQIVEKTKFSEIKIIIAPLVTDE